MVEVSLPYFVLFFLLQGKFSGIPANPKTPKRKVPQSPKNKFAKNFKNIELQTCNL